jgi:hypothetical protein
LSSPANNQVDVIPNPTLNWNSATRSTKYHLQVATDINFNSMVFNDSTLSSVSQLIGPLGTDTKYYWRVRGWNSKGFGIYSAIWLITPRL